MQRKSQESTCQVVCLLLMTEAYGLLIWTVWLARRTPGDGLLSKFTFLAVLYIQVIRHALEIENVTAL